MPGAVWWVVWAESPIQIKKTVFAHYLSISDTYEAKVLRVEERSEKRTAFTFYRSLYLFY
jgi:hypothetical protein